MRIKHLALSVVALATAVTATMTTAAAAPPAAKSTDQALSTTTASVAGDQQQAAVKEGYWICTVAYDNTPFRANPGTWSRIKTHVHTGQKINVYGAKFVEGYDWKFGYLWGGGHLGGGWIRIDRLTNWCDFVNT